MGAPDEAKSELLKDILAFTNTLRSTDAYIVVGVRENPGGRATVVGVTHHIDDASLQQFVNAKTSRRVRFGYVPMTYDGKPIGIIRIDKTQARPIFLAKDYGKLKARQVWIRVGTSSEIASLDDIADMRRPAALEGPALSLRLRKFGSKEAADTILVRSKVLQGSLKPRRRLHAGLATPLGHPLSPFIPLPSMPQPSVREIEQYRRDAALLNAVVLEVANTGERVAQDVVVELTARRVPGVEIRDEGPKRPGSRPRSGPAILATVSGIILEFDEEHWFLKMHLGKIQPGATQHSEPFWIGSSDTEEVCFAARVMGDNIPRPIEAELVMRFEIEHGLVEEESEDEE